MPYKRYKKRRTYKKTYRKRRAGFKRKFRKSSKYEGTVYRKIVIELPFTTFVGRTTELNVFVHWGGGVVGLADTNEVTYVANAEFDAFKNKYTKWRMVGA